MQCVAFRLKGQTRDNILNDSGLECNARYINIHVYTDASRDTEGNVRAAICVPQLNVEQYARLTHNVTLYATEMTALRMPIEWLKSELDRLNSQVVIFSDSLSSLKSHLDSETKSQPKC